VQAAEQPRPLDQRTPLPVEFRPARVGETMTLMGASHDVIDWKALRLLADQLDDAVVVSILDAYTAQLPMRAAALRASVDDAGTPLRDAAHSLTASSFTIGAARLGQLCRDTEAAVERNDVDKARALTVMALAEIDDVSEALCGSPWAATPG
jgi:HPt (histidine-containing phosphotransfer) domain-containing protein